MNPEAMNMDHQLSDIHSNQSVKNIEEDDLAL